MPILTQLLILAILCVIAYAWYLPRKAQVDGFFAKLFAPSASSAAPDAHADSHADTDMHVTAHDDGHQASPANAALSASVKVVVYVPDAHADAVRQAIGEAGGGEIGNYTFCTFSSLGTGRYLPGPGANPMIGSVGVQERVEEERIEFTCSREKLQKVVQVIKKVHPYEEIVIDIYPLEAQ